MKKILKMINKRIIRFVAIGAMNTAISFSILNLSFYLLHTGKIISNIIATCCAMIFSFVLNRAFVFKHKGSWARQAVKFVIITSIGSLLIQNGAYIIILDLIKNHEAHVISLAHSISGLKLSKNFVDINLSAAIAVCFSLLWNYNGYKLVVFKEIKVDEPEKHENSD